MKPAWFSILPYLLAAGVAKAAPVYDFDLPAQPVARALVALTVQANGSLGGEYQACLGQSRRFQQRAPLKTALEFLLDGTGCRFRIADGNAIVIAKPAAPVRRPAPVDVKPSPVPAPAQAQPTAVVVTASHPADTFIAASGPRSTVDGGRLRLAGITTLADVAPLVPGMVATNLGPGRDKILLRGVSDGVFPGEANTTVAIIFDNSPLNYIEKDPSLRLIDIADITVARAPQGLVSSAIGGVVRIRPNPPDPDHFGGEIGATWQSVHNGGSGNAFDLLVNAPLAGDGGAVRAVLYQEREPGYIRDILPTGTSTNSSREKGGRLSYRRLFGARWTLTAGAVWQRLSVADSQYVFNTASDFSRTNRIAEPNSNNANYVFATLSGTLGRARVTWTETYSDHSLAARYDATQSLGVFGQPTTTAASFDSRRHVQSLVSDLSITAPALGGQWRTGLLLASERDASAATLGLITQPDAPLYEDARKDHRLDLSAFVSGVYPLARNLDLEISATAYRFDHDVQSNAVNTAGAVVGKPFTTTLGETGFKPSIAVTYTPFEDLVLGARIATGARPAGINTGVLLARRSSGVSPYQANRTYGSDRVTEYELTQKYTPHGLPLVLSLTEFIADWRNVQADEFSIYNTPITVNVGDGDLSGLEAELIFKPGTGWEIHAIGGTEHTGFGGKVTKAYFSGAYGGLIGVPKYNAGLSITKSVELAPFSLSTSLQYHALGSSRATFDGLTASSLSGYQTLDLSGCLRFGSLSLLLNLTNLTDRKGDTLAFGNPFSVQRGREITPIRPRTVSAKLSYAF